MRILIVYESMFGATRRIAERIAEGCRDPAIAVALRSVRDVPAGELQQADVLVIGGPTHAHGMTRPESRHQAAKWAQDEARHLTLEPGADDGIGIFEFLRDLESAPPLAATFDTRAAIPEIFSGSAARRAARRLRQLGARLVVDPESFHVDSRSVLQHGEEDRAIRLGRAIGAAAASLERAGA
jgi:hypothetical protein